MKKMKFAVLCAAVTAMLGFSSCLDTDNNNTFSGSMFLKVQQGLGTYFTDMYGIKYVPKETLTATPTSELAIVPLTYNSVDDVEYNGENISQVNIAVTGTPAYLRRCNYMSGKPEVENSVSTVVFDGGATWGYGEYVVLPLIYYVHKNTTTSNLEAELNKHHFSLYFDEEEAVSDKTMKLHLRYTIDGVSATTEKLSETYTQEYAEYRYMNLSPLIGAYQNKHGEKPEKVLICYETIKNPNSSEKLTADPTKKEEIKASNSYQIKYKESTNK